MRRFPAEFAELLNPRGKALIANPPRRRAVGGTLFSITDGVMDPDTARACERLLDKHLRPLLRPLVEPIPPDSISSMRENYGEMLPKTVSIKTCYLQSWRYRGYSTAKKIGLIEMMSSESLRRFAEGITGLELARGTHQVICYEHGDYSGPHNDHHPESERMRDGYVDLHIMFGNDAVAHQWIVYEEGGHLRNIQDINRQGAVAVYRLPFWHYTTPLTGKSGRERQARRWLLLVSYPIERNGRNGSNRQPASARR